MLGDDNSRAESRATSEKELELNSINLTQGKGDCQVEGIKNEEKLARSSEVLQDSSATPTIFGENYQATVLVKHSLGKVDLNYLDKHGFGGFSALIFYVDLFVDRPDIHAESVIEVVPVTCYDPGINDLLHRGSVRIVYLEKANVDSVVVDEEALGNEVKLLGFSKSFRPVISSREMNNEGSESYESVLCFDPGILGENHKNLGEILTGGNVAMENEEDVAVVFDELSEWGYKSNGKTILILMCSLYERGCVNDAISLLEWMEIEGNASDTVSLSTLIFWLRKKGRVEDEIRLFDGVVIQECDLNQAGIHQDGLYCFINSGKFIDNFHVENCGNGTKIEGISVRENQNGGTGVVTRGDSGLSSGRVVCSQLLRYLLVIHSNPVDPQKLQVELEEKACADVRQNGSINFYDSLFNQWDMSSTQLLVTEFHGSYGMSRALHKDHW